jgi:hypothetical protein
MDTHEQTNDEMWIDEYTEKDLKQELTKRREKEERRRDKEKEKEKENETKSPSPEEDMSPEIEQDE